MKFSFFHHFWNFQTSTAMFCLALVVLVEQVPQMWRAKLLFCTCFLSFLIVHVCCLCYAYIFHLHQSYLTPKSGEVNSKIKSSINKNVVCASIFTANSSCIFCLNVPPSLFFWQFLVVLFESFEIWYVVRKKLTQQAAKFEKM